MKVQILGTGCAKCKTLYANAEAALKEAGVTAELVKIEDVQEIVKMGVMITPALAVDGQVKVAGKVASPAEIRKLLGV